MISEARHDRSRLIELIRTYDRPGPRYTSYPTAVEFTEAFGQETYEQELARAAQAQGNPLSIYVHLPFCRERCHFCGCHVVITPHEDKAKPYLDLVGREIEMVASRLGERRGFSQLHFGGGTPTYFEPRELKAFTERLRRSFQPLPGAEIAIEVDPRVTRIEHVDALAEVGFNRISMGVQDFDKDVQEAIGRSQSYGRTEQLVVRARANGYTGVNLDLIYGLPFQTEERFEATLQKVIDLEVDRIACYSFAYLPQQRRNQGKIDVEGLPSAREKIALLVLAREKLMEAGYVAIGMDHFARPDDELSRAREQGRLRRNFQGYTVQDAPDVLGFGLSAIGDVGNAYVQNIKQLASYRRAVEANELPIERGVMRTRDDDVRRFVIHELLCNGVLSYEALDRAFGVDFQAYFQPERERLRELEASGLVEVSDEAVRATADGELFVRVIGMCFDTYYWSRHADGKGAQFSKTV
ncbi:MAG: oxygen-independent coproporphyrinogen III oxidase [Planctomycetes bacterium]|nr:oxygen-independent coproporphyrinogen III oxidase [Planctomycetota bacterium]MCB9891982.1 oxygen-independent coproporphyrinogen III oxidase [Planctomycetota bacterium]